VYKQAIYRDVPSIALAPVPWGGPPKSLSICRAKKRAIPPPGHVFVAHSRLYASAVRSFSESPISRANSVLATKRMMLNGKTTSGSKGKSVRNRLFPLPNKIEALRRPNCLLKLRNRYPPRFRGTQTPVQRLRVYSIKRKQISW